MSEQVAMNHTFFSLKLPYLAFVNHFTAPTFQNKASLCFNSKGKRMGRVEHISISVILVQYEHKVNYSTCS